MTELLLGDCREIMAAMPAASVDAVICDPPYDLTAGKHGGSGSASENLNSPASRARITTGFMGKAWDGSGVAFDVATWAAALRVLKPGGHLLAFGAPRTYHRLAVAIEDAGFEVRDSLMWLFGTGFPKSLDVSKAFDKAAGASRPIVGPSGRHGGGSNGTYAQDDWTAENVATMGMQTTAPVTDLARQWEGWGTALKPAYEPIVLARKPLAGTVAANVAEHGTGGLNIDGCRIGAEVRTTGGMSSLGIMHDDNWQPHDVVTIVAGRWPANVLLDDEAARLLDAQTGELSRGHTPTARGAGGLSTNGHVGQAGIVEIDQGTGGASRFFYTSKASRAEREYGLDDVEPSRRADAETRDEEAPGSNNPRLRVGQRRNDHPTVKPVDLMRWLCRLVTPPGGLILDPFVGSGSTGMAALDEGFRFVGIDLDPHYLEIARRRIDRRHLAEALPARAAGQAALF